MGLIRKPAIGDYWKDTHFTATPFFGKKMSRHRFEDIGVALHMVNSATEPDKNSPDHDELFLIRPLLKMCQKNFRQALNPEREIAIDEASCPWKGKVQFKMYNPKKPHKYHIKSYVVSESCSGYILGIDVHCGMEPHKNTPSVCEPKGKNSLTKRVMHLLYESNLLGKGHHLYMDNFYTSPELFEQLFFQDTFACGTFRRQ